MTLPARPVAAAVTALLALATLGLVASPLPLGDGYSIVSNSVSEAAAQQTPGSRAGRLTLLARVREQNVDITNFEASLDRFKTDFGRNFRLASDDLEKVKEALHKSDYNLRIANDKAENLTIKSLLAATRRWGRSSPSCPRPRWS